MKETICGTLGVIGAAIAHFFGGWDASLITLLIFMAIDYGSGLVVAGIFTNSLKSTTGGLNSEICFKGLVKKGMALLIVAVGCRLDLLIGTQYIRDAVCIAFITNEAISIIENAGLMGIPVPKVLINVIDVLKKKNEEVNTDESKRSN